MKFLTHLGLGKIRRDETTWEYRQINGETEDDETPTLKQEHALLKASVRGVPQISLARWLLFAHISLAILSLVFAIVGFRLQRTSHLGTEDCPRCYVDDQQCTVHLSTWSPLVDANVIEYEWRQWPDDVGKNPTYQGPPTYERELAWKSLMNWGTIEVPQERLARLNKSEDVARLTSQTEPDVQYTAILEVQHQLYCLAALRQWTYKDEYLASMMELPQLFFATAGKIHDRLDRCIESLRLSIMCASDVTPMLMQVNSSKPHVFTLDVGTKHKCRKFERITEWASKGKSAKSSISVEELVTSWQDFQQ